MQDVPTRQLIALAAAALVSFAPPRSLAQEPRETSVAEQLQAAKLMQAVLSARDASPEEWRKLDETLAALSARNPGDAMVRNGRAELLWDLGDHVRAIQEWETAERLDPKNPVVLQHLGEAMLTLGETRKSEAYYARAVASDPTNAAAHFALANVCFLFRHDLRDADHSDGGSRLTEALTHFAEATRLAPTNAEYARAYAETFYSLPTPDWSAALTAWEHFRTLSPKPDFAWLQMTRIYLQMGQNDAADVCLQQVQDPAYQRLKAKLGERLNSGVERPAGRAVSPPTQSLAPVGRNSSKPTIDDERRAP
jgi:tetratricopeptide (TPR) repeat protein